MKKSFFISMIFTALILSSCSGLLTSNPTGAIVTEQEVLDNHKELQARLNGVYSLVLGNGGYCNGGQKLIDPITDVLIGDAAIRKGSYGNVFAIAEDETASESGGQLSSIFWSHNYSVIREANLLIKSCNAYASKEGLTEEQSQALSLAKGQVLALRAFAYYQLTNFYTHQEKVQSNELILPYYDETNVDTVQKFTTYNFIITKVFADLDRAIPLLEKYDRGFNKQYINADIAKMILAYAKLNKATYFDSSNKDAECREVISLVDQIIANGQCTVLPLEKVLLNGFNSVSSPNWMWAVDIDLDNTSMINSFFSVADIFTYGYAAAGSYFAIDNNLHNSIRTKLSPTDVRMKWWNIPGGEYSDFPYAPVNKFFDPNRKIDSDKKWLNDMCYMRAEEVYLLGAEAAFAIGDEDLAKQYLKILIEQRDPSNLANLNAMSGESLKSYIIYNWRIEMWLEGKSYMAMKRLGWTQKNGVNHLYTSGQEITSADKRLTFETPLSESIYNPESPR